MEPAFLPKPRPPVKPKVYTTEEEDKLDKEREEYFMMLRRKSIQEIYKDYIFDIEQLKFQKLQEMREKLYLKKIGKITEEDDVTSMNMPLETQNTNYYNLDKSKNSIIQRI